MAKTARLFTFVGLLLACAYPGCRCASGGSQRDIQPEGPGAPAGEDTGDAWLNGELPASILEGEPRQGGEITMHIRVDPPSLNRIVHADAVAAQLTEDRIYESLLRLRRYDHPNYDVEPALAVAMPEVSEDGLVHTFQLRRDVTFHDGQPMDADDVIATFEKVRDETTRAAHLRSYLEELDTVEKVDQYTVRFTWKEPYFLAFDNPYATVPIQPEHVIGSLSGVEYNEADTNPLNRAPVGTGPWKFEQWVPNERIVVRAFDEHWERRPYLDQVTFRIVKEAPTALQLVERGEMDTLDRPTTDIWVQMEDSATLRENFHRSRFFGNNYGWIGWNQENPLFTDAQVRRALTMLVDRPGIVEQLLHGIYRPTLCHFYAPRPECDFGREPVPYDPPAAVELLEEAGWTDTDGDGIRDKDGRAFEFTFMVPASSAEALRFVTKIKEDFDRAGLELNIQRQEWQTFVRRLREHDFDVCTLLWLDTSPRTDPSQIWHSNARNGGSNYIGFSNERVDEIIEEARVTLDEERRIELYQELGRILYDEQPYTWMFTRPVLTLVSKRLRGVRTSLGWWYPQDWWLAEDGE